MRKVELVSLLEPVLGTSSTYLVAPSGGTTPAAVLIIIHFRDEILMPRFILTRRSANLKTHKREISFPGGRLSREDDGDLLRTALRETKEEIGLQFSRQDILGALRPVNTMTSNHFIVPFVTVQDNLAEHKLSAEEVEQIIDAPLLETLQSMASDLAHRSLGKDAWKFVHDGSIIWGATARILKQLYDALIRPS